MIALPLYRLLCWGGSWCAGFPTVNPFATGIAAGFAEAVSLGEGIGLRVIMLLVALLG